VANDGGLRPIFREHLRHMDWTSIETGGTGRGVADSNFCSNGTEGWVEFKQTEGYAVTLRPEQIAWISRRVRHGGRVLIAVRRWHDGGPRRGSPCDELWLLPGSVAALARAAGLRGVASSALGVWEGGPSRWDWGQIGQALLGSSVARSSVPGLPA